MSWPYAAAELADIKAYHAPHNVWAVSQPLVHLAVLALFIWLVLPRLYRLSQRLADTLARRTQGARRIPVLRALPQALQTLWGGPGWGTALFFALGFQLFFQTVFTPVILYLGFFHERRFGLWHATLGRFLWESLKSNLIAAVALGMLTFGVYGLARRLPRWWLVLGVSAAVLLWGSAVFDPMRAQVHHSQVPLPQGELRTRLERLLEHAEVPFRDLVVEKSADVSRRIQAYFAGQGPTRTIVLNDALLAQLQNDEIEAVVAHEAAHVHQKRWPGRLASSFSVLLFLWLTHLLLRAAHERRWLGIETYGDVRTLPLVLGLFTLTSMFAQPVVELFARERERQADRVGLELTQSPDAFRRMLIRAAEVNRMDPDPPALVVFLTGSHPTLVERLALVDQVEEKNKEAVGGPPPTPPPAPADSPSASNPAL